MAQPVSNPNSISAVSQIQSAFVPSANTAPTIQENDTTIQFLDLPATGGGVVSGVIGDATDPAATQGINFKIADADTNLDQLTVTVTSSNQAVVSNHSLMLTGVGADRNLKINPVGVGYADIQIKVSDGANTSVYTLQYGASDGTINPDASHFHTGTSDASTAIAIDSNYMFVADDEGQVIRLYDRNHSGLPVSEFDFTSALGLTDAKDGQFREVDIEASTQVGDRIYWLGSHSNSSSGKDRPNRSRLFATKIVGSGADAKLEFGGYVDFRQDLIDWGDANGYNFSASAATGKATEFPDNFNIEGLTVSPDGNTAYLAFRAPNTPTSTRTNALIAPLKNFADLVDGKATTAVFGEPIELDLGGRGIRSIERNANNEYLIVAGPAGGATGVAPNDFRLYSWTGGQTDAPTLLQIELPDLNTGGSFESIVDLPDQLNGGSQIQLLLDNGDTDWYGDGQDSKDLSQANLQKFASVTVTLVGDTDITAPTLSLQSPFDNGPNDFNSADNALKVNTNPAEFQFQLSDIGDGIDDASVASHVVMVTKDGIQLTAGQDYSFSYADASDLITLTAINGDFSDGNYQISLNQGAAKIADLAGNQMASSTFDLEVDTTIAQTVFQQGSNGYVGTTDTVIQQADPSANNAAVDSLNVDSSSGGGAVQSLLRFDQLFGDGAGQIALTTPIQSARLEVQVTNPGDSLEFHRMLQDWSDTAAWNSLGDGVQADGVEAVSSADAVTGPIGPGLLSIDVTNSLQAWQADPSSNFGWAILPTDSNGVDFYSSEAATAPRLVVEFSLPPPDSANNRILGTGGDDRLEGTSAANLIKGLSGNDTLRGFFGNDKLRGGKGDDLLRGGKGNDLIEGGKGDDTLEGSWGDDTLVGGKGNDRLTGGEGQDIFVYKQVDHRRDTITDFEIGIDTIDLSNLFKGSNYTSANAFKDYVKLEQLGSDTQVRVDIMGDSGDQFKTLATLNNIEKTALNTDHFALA